MADGDNGSYPGEITQDQAAWLQERAEARRLAWKHGIVMVPAEPTDAMIDAGLAATAAYLDIKGSALTVNREKMRRRYKAMIEAART